MDFDTISIFFKELTKKQLESLHPFTIEYMNQLTFIGHMPSRDDELVMVFAITKNKEVMEAWKNYLDTPTSAFAAWSAEEVLTLDNIIKTALFNKKLSEVLL